METQRSAFSVRLGIGSDNRIGYSFIYPSVGYGGSCFPKDIQAMINFAESLDIEPSVLLGAWDKNLDVRPEEDWKKLKGRAVVEKENA